MRLSRVTPLTRAWPCSDIYASPCVESFKAYTAALEKRNLEFASTRPEEAAFNKCWAERKQ